MKEYSKLVNGRIKLTTYIRCKLLAVITITKNEAGSPLQMIFNKIRNDLLPIFQIK